MDHRRPPRSFTPDAIENARQRYEETDELQQSIADDFGVHRKTLNRLAQNQNWKLRKDRKPRDLPRDLRLSVEAAKAVRAEAEAALAALQKDGRSAPWPAPSGDTPSAAPSIAERALDKELAAVELMRAQLGSRPQPPADGERTARTLERLTDTLVKVQRLRTPHMPMTGSHDDDLPRDVDEFRRALARRIEAFVRSRADNAVSATGAIGGATAP